MDATNHIIVGTKIPRDAYEDQFGHPYKMDEKTEDLVAVWGGEKQWDEIIVGEIQEKIDTYGGVVAREPTDLISMFASKRKSVEEKLADVGIEDREVSVYLVGSML
jgi:hypothetical protein